MLRHRLHGAVSRNGTKSLVLILEDPDAPDDVYTHWIVYNIPPLGSTHRYIFRLYALDRYLTLPTADRAAIDQALASQTIAKTGFITTFSR